jgi:hypothetical protein
MVCGLVCLATCKSRPQTPDNDVVGPATPKVYAADENISDLDPDEANTAAFALTESLPHPSSPTAWNTRALIMTTPHPPEARLITCHNEMLAIAKNALSDEAMVWALERVSTEISANVGLYHWCFYNSMMLLDNKLLNDGMGLLLDQKAKNFALSFRALWILALSLEEVRRDPARPYFEFLKVRYLELSRDYFGRELNVVGRPFGEELKRRQMNKKAGPAPSDL